MKKSEIGSGAVVGYALAMAMGSIIYFSLSFEPALHVTLSIFFMVAVLGVVAVRQTVFPVSRYISAVIIWCICAASGFINAQLHTHAQPPIEALPWYGTVMQGKVRTIDHYEDSRQKKGNFPARMISVVMLGDVHFLSGVERDTLPMKRMVRLRLHSPQQSERFKPGDIIEVRAMLHYVPPPAFPGGADGEFQAWFSGLGGWDMRYLRQG